MEVIVVLLVMVVGSSLKKLVTSVAGRYRDQGRAELIAARGEAERARAEGKAAMIRARSELTRKTSTESRTGEKKRAAA
ncbi:hypothetical protein [Streptomyces sp. NPDC058745]|uniref:hypothetical protein n=1 Tax=Streptomyces sp. NPDC058745 TaxID=3346621 RepID=UPI00367BD57B